MAFAYDASVIALSQRIAALEAGGSGNPAVVVVRSAGAGQNSRVAVQAALDSGGGSPTIVYLPDDRYDVWPDAKANGLYPGNSCLTIRYSNTWLVGAGRGQTSIYCWPAGGTDPATTWEVLDSGGVPTLWRGHGIVLAGSAVFENPQTNVRIADLRLTGNSPTPYPLFQFYPGPAFPADPVTGANWDSTNQGVKVGNGTALDEITLEDCELDSFRGEVVYYGGAGLQDLYIRRCCVHDCYGSAISCSGRVHVEDCEVSGGYNAVENTPDIAGGLFVGSSIRGSYFHDNVIGVVITSNAAHISLGRCRVRIEGNRFHRNYRGSVWVRGGIAGLQIRDNDIADSGQGTDASVFVANAYGYAPEDVTIEGNVFRAETTFTSQPMRISQDSGYPLKNIRVLGNRVERSKYVQDGSGVIGGSKSVLWDSTSTVYVEGNDFSRGGTVPWTVGDSLGSGDAAIPFFGVSQPNKWSEADSPGTWAFSGSVAATSMAIRPTAPIFQLATPSAGWNTATSMGTTGIPAGSRSYLYVPAGDATRGVYFPATGTGWRFRRPYWLTAWGHSNVYPMLAVKYVGNIWCEDFNGDGTTWDAMTWHPDLNPPPAFPVHSGLFWLSGATADTFEPTIPFYFTNQVQMSPTNARTYTAFSDAPEGSVLSVAVNANVTINNSTTIKTAGGVAFAPGGTGGVLNLIRPRGSSNIYEVSRFAY